VKRLLGRSMPFFLYCSGLGALMLSDVLVSRYASPEQVVSWAKTRSLIAILGIVATMGLDQLLMRRPEAAQRIVKLALVQLLPLSACAALLSSLVSQGTGGPLIFTILLFGSGLSYIAFQYFRSRDRKLLSQFSQQGWKLLLLCLVFLSFMGVPLAPYAAIAVAISILTIVNLTSLVTCDAIQFRGWFTLKEVAVLYRSSLPLMSLSVLLAAATTGEQLFVTDLAPPSEAARYFAHAVFFQYPVSILNGYIAFWIGPWLLRHRSNVVTIARLSWRKWLLLTVMVSSVIHVAGLVAWKLLFVADSETSLRLLFFLVSLLRTVDVFASSYNGVLSSEGAQYRLIGLYCIDFATAVLLGIALCDAPSLSLGVPIIVAACNCVHWGLRTISGIWLMLKESKASS